MAKPVVSTSRLHFDDLEHRRFEDLCLNLVYGMRTWSDIRHYGRTGQDGGIDIMAVEVLDDNASRTWHIQCRRYVRANAQTLKTAIDDITSGADRPDVLLVVVGCDVTRQAHEAFSRHAAQKGIGESFLWTSSILEAKLYRERRDLLFAYFGIAMAQESRAREETVRRNIRMKKFLRKELRGNVDDPRDLAVRPYRKFRFSKAIIRSVEECTYPEIDPRRDRYSSWFGLEFFDEYHNGIEFILGIVQVAERSDGYWSVVPYDYEAKTPDLLVGKAWYTGCIPYRNIVEVDLDGDEYYREPHFYCRYADAGSPYEECRYRLCEDGRFPEVYPAELRMDLAELEAGGV